MRTQESQLDDDDVDRKFQEGPVTDWGGGQGPAAIVLSLPKAE